MRAGHDRRRPKGSAMSASGRGRRLVAFDDRGASDPAALHYAPRIGRYITVNPMSDEAALLVALGLSPEACIKVDCYWNHGDDVHFVQINTVKYARGKAPGVYGRDQDHSAYKLGLVVVVTDLMISRCVVEESLAYAEMVLRTDPLVGRALRYLG